MIRKSLKRGGGASSLLDQPSEGAVEASTLFKDDALPCYRLELLGWATEIINMVTAPRNSLLLHVYFQRSNYTNASIWKNESFTGLPLCLVDL